MRTLTRVTLRARNLVQLYVESTAMVLDRAAESNGKARATVLDHGSRQTIGLTARRLLLDPHFGTMAADLQEDVRDIARWCENSNTEPPPID